MQEFQLNDGWLIEIKLDKLQPQTRKRLKSATVRQFICHYQGRRERQLSDIGPKLRGPFDLNRVGAKCEKRVGRRGEKVIWEVEIIGRKDHASSAWKGWGLKSVEREDWMVEIADQASLGTTQQRVTSLKDIKYQDPEWTEEMLERAPRAKEDKL